MTLLKRYSLMRSDFESNMLREDTNMGRIAAREFFGSPRKMTSLTRIYLTDSKVFGPFPLPDDQHLLRFKLARCTTARPGIWADGDTVIRITGTMYIAGQIHESFSPDLAYGGIATGKDGQEAQWSTIGIGPCPKICTICGERFHPGMAAYNQSLLHSTIALKPGQFLPGNGTLNDYKLKIVPNDDVIFTRTYHTPTPQVLENRTASVLVELINGPPLISEFALEVL